MKTPGELKHMLAGMADVVAAHLLPKGQRQGNSWCAGSADGEPGQSLRVCLHGSKAGVWADFSGEEKGDLLDLWQQCRRLSFVDTLKEVKAYLGVQDVSELYTPKKRTPKPVKLPECTNLKGRALSWFESRGIFQPTLDLYQVREQGDTIVFQFLSPENELELVKYRDLKIEEKTGKKKIWSNPDPEYHLWGWQVIDNDTRQVVICEGEIDALTWHQQGFQALSIPQGGGSGEKQAAWLENDYDRLLRFETIYVSMDMDPAGQAAIKPIVARLGIERCKVVDLGEFKDANEAHVNGMLLKRYLDKARTQDPEELKPLTDHHDAIMNEFKYSDLIGTKLPWQKTHPYIRLRPADISVWAGINSHGKSLALSQVAVDAVYQGEKVCIASMEMKPWKLGRKMYQQVIGNNNPNASAGMMAAQFLGDRIWLFEAYGTAKASRIIEVFTYAQKRYGVTHFVVDSLAKCGFGEDDYNGQKAFVDRLMEFAGAHNVHVHLVVHIRKGSSEESIPGKFDVKGSSAITDMVDNVFIWWRNKKKEAAKERGGQVNPHDADAVLNCVKQRETGEEPMLGLFFHKESCQFLGNHEDLPKEYLVLTCVN